MEAGDWIALGMLGAALSGLMFGQLTYTLKRINQDRRDSIDRDDATIRRIEQTRDEYVRKDDLAQHLTRLEKSQDMVLVEIQRVHQRIDWWAGHEKVPPLRGSEHD